jgi:hypothetical protein
VNSFLGGLGVSSVIVMAKGKVDWTRTAIIAIEGLAQLVWERRSSGG